jgi:Tol biopolymer transport system component
MDNSPTGGVEMKSEKIEPNRRRLSEKPRRALIPAILIIGLAAVVCAAFALQSSSQHKVLFEKAKFTMETKGDLKGAIDLFEEIIKKYPDERDYAAKSLYLMGICYERLGAQQVQMAQEVFQKIVKDYPDQTDEVNLAKEKLAGLVRAARAPERGGRDLGVRKISSLEILGSPSPDGRLISFVDWDTGDLALFDVGSEKKRRVTDKGSWAVSSDFAEESVFSPDGEAIAYNWFSYKNLRYDLRRTNIDGSGQTVLLGGDDVYFIWPCAWTPEGKDILSIITSKEMLSRIAFVSASGENVRTVKEFKSGAPGKLSLSSDGRWIAFDYPNEVPWRTSSDKGDIYLLSVDGRREVPLVAHPADDRLLGWTPDGRSILFSSDRSGTWDAWIMPVEDGAPGGPARLIKRDFGALKIFPMGFTKDSSFYYGIRFSQVDVYLVSLDPATGKPSGRAGKAALRFEGSNTHPCWSPDGSRLAYTSFRERNTSEPSAICVKSMISGEEKEFFPNIEEFDTVAWFPDAEALLVRGLAEDRRAGLFRMDLTNGNLSSLLTLDDLGGLHGPILSPDGKKIFYDVDDLKNDTFRIMTFDINSGRSGEILRGQNQFLSYDLSPDGKSLVFKDEEAGVGCLKIMPSGGGEKQVLLRLNKDQGVNSVAWSPDGQFVYFSKWEKGSSKSGACNLWRIRASGGTPEKFDLTIAGLENLSFHPSGGQLAFNSWSIEAEVWVMENFLPKDDGKE